MNKVILMGRLTREPDVRYSNGGERQMAIARFTLAVDRRGRRDQNDGQPTADFIGCVAFDRQAEFVEKYLHQGTKIALTGRIQTGNYTNKDGQKVYTTDVVVEEMEFAESKNAGNNGVEANNSRPNPAQASNNAFVSASSFSKDGFMNIPDGVEDEGLPFN